MKIISWNINGIRAISKKGFWEWLAQEQPDILCLQETKAHPDQLTFDMLSPAGYQTAWSAAERKGYSGVAIFYNNDAIKITEGIGIEKFDCEGRTLIAEWDDYCLYNIYFPNGSTGNKRVPYKMEYNRELLKQLKTKQAVGQKIIVCGDVNTAHTAIDLTHPNANKQRTGFLPEERAWVDDLIAAGFVDTFRHQHPDEPEHYTWWDYKTRARERNVGWRIDYFFIDQIILGQLQNAFILKDIYGSDHCPIGIDLELGGNQ